jgi:choline-sulfatase
MKGEHKMPEGVSRRPNIVFIMSDDQGSWAMGCAGNEEIRTPNIDSLAAEGMRFSNFFCTSPVCSPARASILTGRIPSQHGIHDWIRSGNVDKGELDESLQQNGIFRDETKPIEYLKGIKSYPQILNENGYTCALSGKWHMGDSIRPQQFFTHWFTIARGGCLYYKPDVVREGKIQIEDQYITDLITEDALDFLDKQGKEETPFYLSVHYTAPHSPWDRDNHPKEFFDMYEDCPFESCPDLPLHPWQVSSAPHGTGEVRKELLKGYYASVTAMDRQISRIIDKINQMGIRENTLIIFTSDNGMNMGHHGIWGKGNGTFPQNMFDTSVKVPFIVSWPGHIPENQECQELLSQYDIMPTLLDLLDIKNPVAGECPGHSFAPILMGQEYHPGENVVVYDEYGPVRMIRSREWKYIHRYPYGPNEFYNLKDDPDEQENLIQRKDLQPNIEKLKGQLESWFVRYANPEIDGTREGTVGSGQLCLAGTWAKGKQVYYHNY